MILNNHRKKTLPDLTIDDLMRIVAEGKDGKPNYGFILWYYRVLMGWTAEDLALYYSEALGNELVTASWIYLMENQNRVPIDEKRRWILAALLNIPPTLFGLQPRSLTLAGLQENILDLFSTEKIDVAEYHAKLEAYCTSWPSGGLLQTLLDIKRRVDRLEGQAHYGSLLKDKQIPRLLCEYRILLGDTLSVQGVFDLAISSLSKAIFVAEREKLYDTWAHALRQRGTAYLSRGELTAGLVDYVAAQPDFEKAAADLEAARGLETHLSSQRNGLVCLAAADAYARVAQNKEQLSDALKLIDESRKALGKDGNDEYIAARFDEIRCHLDRGITLLASPLPSLRAPVAAREELEKALTLMPPGMKLRQVEANTRLAEAYFFEGQFPKSKQYYPDELFTMAIGHAEAALEVLKSVDKDQDLRRLENLYRRLRESSYGKNENVAQLGVEIVKVQQRHLFYETVERQH